MGQYANRLLDAFSADIRLIEPHLRFMTLPAGRCISEQGDQVRQVLFLENGFVSNLAAFEDGTEIECAYVSRDGAVGVFSAMGIRTSVTRDVCLIEAQGYAVDSQVLSAASARSPRVREVLDRYCAAKMNYALRVGACNGRHSVDQRLARWLLTCADAICSDAIPISQDLLAKLLGVQRTSINPALQRLKSCGMLSLSRSRIIIEQRGGMEERCCECYRALRATEQQILGLCA
jgi:CRP-like cAMP-binding protein